MQRKNAIKSVIFDIGNVALFWDEIVVYRHVAKTTGQSLGKVRKICEAYGVPFELGKITEKQYWLLVSKRLGYKKGLNGKWLDHYGEHAKWNTAVIKSIKKLRHHYKTAALTNVIMPEYNYNKQHGLYRLFDKTFASCILGMRKPEIRIYSHTARQLKLRPGQCLFIDDKKVNIEAARKVGMNAFVFKSTGQMRKELKRYGVKT